MLNNSPEDITEDDDKLHKFPGFCSNLSLNKTCPVSSSLKYSNCFIDGKAGF